MAGSEGKARIARVMSGLRSRPPEQIAGSAVLERRDYAARTRVWFDGQTQPIALPASDVLAYELEGDTRVVVRPSGTEPKLKVYLDHREAIGSNEALDFAEERAQRRLVRLDYEIRTLVSGYAR